MKQVNGMNKNTTFPHYSSRTELSVFISSREKKNARPQTKFLTINSLDNDDIFF